jgi:spore photoproduct lyase
MQSFRPEEVVVERGSEASPIFRNLRSTLPQVSFRFVDDVIAENRNLENRFGAAKKKLFLTRHKGEFLKKCPGSEGQVCCNYFVINFASNCPMDCTCRNI